MKLHIFILTSVLLFLVCACNRPEDKLVGKWEYDSFEVDESGIGFILSFLPKNWKGEVDEWLEKTKGLTNSVLEFSGAAEKFTNVKGNFSITPDFSEIRLLINDKEQVMNIEEFNEKSFIYKKEFTKYEVPLTLKIKYIRTN